MIPSQEQQQLQQLEQLVRALVRAEFGDEPGPTSRQSIYIHSSRLENTHHDFDDFLSHPDVIARVGGGIRDTAIQFCHRHGPAECWTDNYILQPSLAIH